MITRNFLRRNYFRNPFQSKEIFNKETGWRNQIDEIDKDHAFDIPAIKRLDKVLDEIGDEPFIFAHTTVGTLVLSFMIATWNDKDYSYTIRTTCERAGVSNTRGALENAVQVHVNEIREKEMAKVVTGNAMPFVRKEEQSKEQTKQNKEKEQALAKEIAKKHEEMKLKKTQTKPVELPSSQIRMIL